MKNLRRDPKLKNLNYRRNQSFIQLILDNHSMMSDLVTLGKRYILKWSPVQFQREKYV